MFAVAGESTVTAPGVQPSEEKPAEKKLPEAIEGLKKDSWRIVLIAAGVAIAIAVVVYLFKMKSFSLAKNPKSKVQSKLSYGEKIYI